MDLIDLKEDTDVAEVLDSYRPPSERSYRSVSHLNSAESAAHGYLLISFPTVTFVVVERSGRHRNFAGGP